MRIFWFLIFTTLFSAPFWWLTRRGGNLFYINSLMWSPALGAVLALKLTGGSLSELGWRGSGWKWLVLAWAIPAGAVLLLISIVSIFHLASFPNPDFVAGQIQRLHLPADTSPARVVSLYIALALLIGAVGTGAAALGEEIGWRGFLTVETQRRLNYTSSSLVVGLIWGLWHMPLMWGMLPAWTLVGFMVGIVAYSFVYGWLRLVSGSVWTSTMLHAMHNALFGFYGNALVFPPEGDPREKWTSDSGIVFCAIAVALAIVFWLNRKRAVAAFEQRDTPAVARYNVPHDHASR